MILESKFRMRSPDRDAQNGYGRVAVIGSKGVGKTALTVRYLTRRFIGEYQSDTDMVYKVSIPLDGSKTSLEILDISSNTPSDQTVISRETLEWAESWLVVYSITSRESFDVASRAIDEIVTAWPGDTPTPPVLIMANKKDLEHIRMVSTEHGKMLANRFGCRFVEVSAAEMDSQVTDSLDSLLRTLSQHKGQTSPRLRKLSVSKMFNNLINRNNNNVGGNVYTTTVHQGAPCNDRPLLLPKVPFREKNRRKKQS